MEEHAETAVDAVMTEAPVVGDVGLSDEQQQQQRQHQEQHQHHDQHHHDDQVQVPSQDQDSHLEPDPEPDPGHDPDLPIDPAISSTTESSSSASRARQPHAPVPDAFPKKRRGRPPGRPNATVREDDYSDNPLVQAWNAAKADRAVPAVSIRIRDALTERSLVHETQRALFRLPSRETIVFVQGWITAKHIASQRPSYVNGLLIHSRGQDAPQSCLQCEQKRARHALGPFLTCRVLPGSFHNSCSNCKWFDNTSACSLYTGPKPNRKRKAKNQPAPPAPAPPESLSQPAGVPEADMAATGSEDGNNGHPVDAPGSGDAEGTGADSRANAEYAYGSADARPASTPGLAQATEDDLDDAQLAAELLPEIQRPDS